MVIRIMEMEIHNILMPERSKESATTMVLKGTRRLIVSIKNAHKHQKNLKQKDAKTEVNANNMEQLLACIVIEKISFWAMEGLVVWLRSEKRRSIVLIQASQVNSMWISNTRWMIKPWPFLLLLKLSKN